MADGTLAALPARLGPYPVRAKLGAGGMAEVYEVLEPWTGAVRALKVQSRLASPRRQAEALREYQLLSALQHPALPRVYRAGFTGDGRAYVVMERLAGEDARAWVRAFGPLQRPERVAAAVAVLGQLADGLACLHAASIVHGDLKPGNALVGDDGRVRLIDLAGARHLGADQPWIPDGAYYGTHSFTAPEQNARLAVGTAADCYSLGVTAYVLLTDDNPFQAEAVEETFERHRSHSPEPPHRLVPAVPESVSGLVMGLLAKAPEARPDAAAARDVLAEALAAAGGSAAGTGRGGGAPAEPLASERFGLEEALAVARLRLRQRPGAEVLVAGEAGSGRAAVLRRLAWEAAAAGRRVLLLPGGDAQARARVEAGLGALADLDLLVMPDLDRLDPTAVRALRKARARLDPPPALAASARPGVGFRKLFADTPPLVLPRLGKDRLARHPAWGDASPPADQAVREAQRLSGGLAAWAELVISKRLTPRRSQADAWPENLATALAGMGEEARAVTVAVALADAPLDVESLAEAFELDEAEVERALDEAADGGALHRRAADGTWALSCGLWGAAVLEGVPEPARRALAGRLIDALVDRPVAEAHIRLLAAAGRRADAAHELLLWSRGVSAERSLPVFEALVEHALGPLDSELEVNLLRAAAAALTDVSPLDGRAGRWLALARERAVGPQVERVVAEQLARRRRLERRWREHGWLLRAATHSPTILAERALGLGREALWAGRWGDALQEGQIALQAARVEADLERQAAAREVLGEAHYALGELQPAARELARALGILAAERLGRGRVAARLAEVERVQGRLTRAAEVLDQAQRGEDEVGTEAGALDRAWLWVARAANELELGRLHAADDLLGRLDDLPAAALTGLAWERARLRQRLEVARGAPAAPRDAPAGGTPPPLLEARWQAQRAEALAALGRTEEALERVAAAEGRLAEAAHLPWWTEVCIARVRALGRAGKRQPLPGPVRDWLADAPAFLLRLSYYLAVAERDRGGPAAWDALAQLRAFLPGLSADDRAAFQLMPWVAFMEAASPAAG